MSILLTVILVIIGVFIFLAAGYSSILLFCRWLAGSSDEALLPHTFLTILLWCVLVILCYWI